MRMKNGLWLIAAISMLTLVGCGGGSLSSSSPSSVVTLQAISITPAASTIAAGTPQQFKATGSYSDGSSKDLTASVAWRSSAASVATISSTGLLTPLAAGQTTVSAALESSKGSTGLTVTDNLVSILVNGNGLKLNIGSAIQLTAMGTYQDKKAPKLLSGLTWSSSDSAVATVSSTGLVTGVGPGSATIAAALSGVKGSADLGVNTALLSSISIGPNSLSVNVASSQQLSATGHYNDGSAKDISSSVVWKSSDATKATISAQGLATGVYHGKVTVSATFHSVSGSAQLTVNAVLNSISISPVGPSVLLGANQQFTAMGFFNDGSSSDLTSSATWTSSNQAVAQISNGLANSVASGAVNLTASQNSVSATTSLDIVTNQYANLNGNYAFTLNSLDARGPAMWAGSINFDGSGGVSGLEDCNTANGVQQAVTVGGSYLLYPDGRGNLAFSANACHASGITLRFMLASAGTSGSLIEFDGASTAHGTLVQQNPAAFNTAAINGTYVFRAAGVDARVSNPNGPEGIAAVGMFAADGAGNISGGVDDINDYGVVNGQNPLSASLYTMNSNGRGTLQFTDGNGTTNYAVYLVDATQMYFIETDAAPATAMLGVADLQASGSYGNVTGTFSYLIDSPVVVLPNVPQIVVKEGQLGNLILTGASTLSGTMNNDVINGTFMNNYGGINGRGQITTCGSGQTCTQPSDQRTYFYYMVSPSKMLIMQAFSYSNYPQFSPAVGEADVQALSPYSVSSLQGNYVLQAHQGNSFADGLMLVNFNGAGQVSGIVDANQVGGVSSTLLSSSYLQTPTALGYTVIQISTPGGTQSYYFYLYSDAGAFVGGVSTPLDGTLTQQ